MSKCQEIQFQNDVYDRFISQYKQNHVLGNAIPVLGAKPKRGWCVFWLFFRIGILRVLVIFQNRHIMCSAISFKRSRRELSIDVAEPRSTLKTYPNTHYPRFNFITKTGIAFPKTRVLFIL